MAWGQWQQQRPWLQLSQQQHHEQQQFTQPWWNSPAAGSSPSEGGSPGSPAVFAGAAISFGLADGSTGGTAAFPEQGSPFHSGIPAWPQGQGVAFPVWVAPLEDAPTLLPTWFAAWPEEELDTVPPSAGEVAQVQEELAAALADQHAAERDEADAWARLNAAAARADHLSTLRQRRGELRAELRACQGEFEQVRETGLAATQATRNEARQLSSELRRHEEAHRNREAEVRRCRQHAAAVSRRSEQLIEHRRAVEEEVSCARWTLEAAEARNAAQEVWGAAAATWEAVEDMVERREAECEAVHQRGLETAERTRAEEATLEAQAEALRHDFQVALAAEVAASGSLCAEEHAAAATRAAEDRAKRRADAARAAEVEALQHIQVAKAEVEEEAAQLQHAESSQQELTDEAAQRNAWTRRVLFWALAGMAFVDSGFRVAEALGW